MRKHLHNVLPAVLRNEFVRFSCGMHLLILLCKGAETASQQRKTDRKFPNPSRSLHLMLQVDGPSHQ
jgi:hypothetical protein